MSRPPAPRLPLAPLIATVEGRRWMVARNGGVQRTGPVKELSRETGVTTRSIHRYAHDGVPVDQADRMAIALGEHPAIVWGDAWVAVGLAEWGEMVDRLGYDYLDEDVTPAA